MRSTQCRNGSRDWLHDEMKMIRHQTESQEVDGMRGLRRGKQVEEGCVVALLVEDGCAAVGHDRRDAFADKIIPHSFAGL